MTELSTTDSLIRWLSMPVKIDAITPRSKSTKIDYEAIFIGDLLRLFPFVDFMGDPRTAADTINSYARNHDIAAVALPVVKKNGHGFVEVWGDPGRTWLEGPPPHIMKKLAAGGYDFRKRRAKRK